MKSLFIDQQKRFRLIAFIWGIMFSILILPWQGPDDYSHVEMIGEEIRNPNLAEILLEEVSLNEHGIRWNPKEKIEISKVWDAMLKKPEYKVSDCAPKGISIKVVRHLPAIVGIVIGVMFRLPAYWVIILGRIFSLCFYIVICSSALKLMPLEKEMLEIIMLLPMCIQQAASLSYDAVLFSMSFFLIAYILYLKFKAEKFGFLELIVIVGILYCIAETKIPYVLLGGLIFIIPLSKVDLSFGKLRITGSKIYKFGWLILLISILMMFVILYIGKNNMWIQLVAASIQNFPRTMYLFARTWKVWSGDILLSMIGNFGWLDTPTSTWFVALISAFVVVMSITHINRFNSSQYQLKFMDKFIMYIVCGSCLYLITVSMVSFSVGYKSESWTQSLYEITEIDGLQGRYYINILPILLLPLPKIFEMKERDYKILSTSMYLFSTVYTCMVVAFRYWRI